MEFLENLFGYGENNMINFDLTPVQEQNGILFKRDDLFVPFKDSDINGAKVRQCLNIIDKNYQIIVDKYNSTVCTLSIEYLYNAGVCALYAAGTASEPKLFENKKALYNKKIEYNDYFLIKKS